MNRPISPPVRSKSITITVNRDGTFQLAADKKHGESYVQPKSKAIIQEIKKQKMGD